MSYQSMGRGFADPVQDGMTEVWQTWHLKLIHDRVRPCGGMIVAQAAAEAGEFSRMAGYAKFRALTGADGVFRIILRVGPHRWPMRLAVPRLAVPRLASRRYLLHTAG